LIFHEWSPCWQSVRIILNVDRRAVATNAFLEMPPKSLRDTQVPLPQLCETDLLQRNSSEFALDPVARFHLHNGAKLERINWSANTSKRGLRESFGLMVYYLYEPARIEVNHEKFVQGERFPSPPVGPPLSPHRCAAR
jgi:malonyl-CoA decarboxylase